jgi:hypothetical protein
MWYRLIKQEVRIADLVLVVLVVVSIVLGFRAYSIEPNDAKAVVYKNGIVIGEYSLHQDRIIDIDEHNSIAIKDGMIGMISSDCPDKRCVKQGYTKSMPIICLPNRVVIEIKVKQDKIHYLQ